MSHQARAATTRTPDRICTITALLPHRLLGAPVHAPDSGSRWRRSRRGRRTDRRRTAYCAHLAAVHDPVTHVSSSYPAVSPGSPPRRTAVSSSHPLRVNSCGSRSHRHGRDAGRRSARPPGGAVALDQRRTSGQHSSVGSDGTRRTGRRPRSSRDFSASRRTGAAPAVAGVRCRCGEQHHRRRRVEEARLGRHAHERSRLRRQLPAARSERPRSVSPVPRRGRRAPADQRSRHGRRRVRPTTRSRADRAAGRDATRDRPATPRARPRVGSCRWRGHQPVGEGGMITAWAQATVASSRSTACSPQSPRRRRAGAE